MLCCELLLTIHFRQDTGINTVLTAELEEFQIVKTRLLALLEKQLTGYRCYFPFNRPDGALEKLLALMERVRSLLSC